MRNGLLLILVGLVAVLNGCATGYARVAKAPEAAFGKYQILELPDLAGGGQVPQEVKTDIPDKIAQELNKQGLFAKVERGDTAVGESVLQLQGQVIQYNPGSRGMRYLTGPLLGAGKGSIIVQVKFIDKASGNDLSEATFEGEIKGGFFGGGIDETHDAIAKEIVQFIKSNF